MGYSPSSVLCNPINKYWPDSGQSWLDCPQSQVSICWGGSRDRGMGHSRKNQEGNSLVVQWLRLPTSTAGRTGLIPGGGTKIPQAMWHGVAKKKKKKSGASLVVQWLRIRLPMQGTRVRALVREDPTCHGASKPVHHNYWACALKPASHNYWAHVPQLLKPTCLEPVLGNEKPPQWEACAPRWRVTPARRN